MKIPLPLSPPISPFLNDLQGGKLVENIPPDKNFPPKKNNISPILYNPQSTSDDFSSKVQGTKFLTTEVDGRTSENQKQSFVEKDIQCSNNTSIIKRNTVKKTMITTKRSPPLSPTPLNSIAVVVGRNDNTKI